jgi:predicted RNase H-like HicB family nuclease
MKRPFAATVWREGNWYISQCLEVDVASQGESEEAALANLKEALELHFEPPQATRPPKVRTIEVEVGRLKPLPFARSSADLNEWDS